MFSTDSPSPSKPPYIAAEPPVPRWKRALDLSFCIVALPILSLASLFMAVLVVIVSPGPIFYRQERVGYMGRRFTLYKFRTMRVGASTDVHKAHFAALVSNNRPMQKLDATSDSRLIAGGRWLRALGVDELPQLVNVLRGDMSLVGPRPCLPYEYDQYTARQRHRFHSVPGLTGLWQVSGKNRTTFDEMINFDIRYNESRSLWLDLKIIASTAPALWRQVLDTRRARKTRGTVVIAPPAPAHPTPEFSNLKPALSARLHNSIAQ